MTRTAPWLTLALLLSATGCGDTETQVAACVTRSDCPQGYTCEAQTGTCVPEQPCATEIDCCVGMTCLNGGCRKLDACVEHGDCAADSQVCDRGQCVAATCSVDGDCAGPTRCIGAVCGTTPPCGGCADDELCEPRTNRCVRLTSQCAALSCPAGHARLVANYDELRAASMSCTPDAATCQCALLPRLEPAAPGPWLTLLATDAGPVAVARDQRYGDLVAVPIAADGAALSASVLDGVPTGPVVGDPAGPRGGVAAPGADVGRHSAAVGVNGGLLAITHDATAGTLRLIAATASPETGITVQTAYELDTTVSAGFGADLATDGQALHAAWFRMTTDGTLALIHGTASASDTPAAGDWTLTAVQSGPTAPAFEVPCQEACGPLQICAQLDDGPACAQPDLVARCEPGCARDALCIAGACRTQLRRAVGLLPWRDQPGSEAAVAISGGGPVVAWYDQPAGAVRLAVQSADQGFTTTRLDGGEGDDVGRHIAVAAGADGALVIAYRDVSRGVLRLLYGPSPLALTPHTPERGGIGIDVAIDGVGQVILAHGTSDGSAVRVLVGTPGDWVSENASLSGHVGRFTSLLSSGGDFWLATVTDRLTEDLRPNPGIAATTINIY